MTSPAALPGNMAPSTLREAPKQLNRVERFLANRMTKKLERFVRKHTVKADSCAKIVLQTGEVVEAEILEITTDVVRYKRCGNPEDPSMMLAKSEVLSVIAEDGGFLFRNSGRTSTPRRFDESSGEVGGGVFSKAAIASPILSIVAMLLGFLPAASLGIGLILLLALASFFMAIAGITFGVAAISRIRRSRGRLRGKAFAIAGIILGSLYLFIILILIAVAL